MRKVIKMIIYVILGLILLVILFLFWASKQPTVSDDYYKKTQSGGVLEEKYQNFGNHEVSYLEKPVIENYKKYEIYYPTNIDEIGQCPVVIFSNGTGCIASKYAAQLKHMASWGFIVIGTEEENSWNGFSSEMCLRFLIKVNENEHIDSWESNPLYKHVNLNAVGVAGHSQGGVGVFNAVVEQKHGNMIKSIFSASPTHFELAHNLEWDYDVSKIDIPVMLISTTGDGDVKLVVSQKQLEEIYNALPENIYKIMAVRNNADHGTAMVETDGYMTAWFLATLCDDATAKKVFEGSHAELLNNSLYENIYIKNQSIEINREIKMNQ